MPERRSNITFLGRTIIIESIDFIGQASVSESGEWVICWGDYDFTALNENQQIKIGYRKQGCGLFVLFNTKTDDVVLKGELERPNSGYVSNNGYFSLEDWHFSDGLSSTFYVFSPKGEIIIKKRFQANIFNSSISKEGILAVCQTCHNPSSEDGNLLTLFDLNNKKELFSINPIERWAEKYDFIEDQRILIVNLKDIGNYRYDRFGKFLDQDRINADRLKCKNYGVILRAAEGFLKEPNLDQDRILDILKAITRARSIGADQDTGNKIAALKIQGFALELLNREADALAVYEEALSLNPKIGVKRRAQSLRKKLIKQREIYSMKN